MSQKAKKIFIVSLDGATFSVLRPLMEQGFMPNLAHMAAQGIASQLLSVVPPVTAPAWTSFMTGKQPSKHGIFDFRRFDEKDYTWKINNSDHIRSKTLWQLLGDNGKRVLVLNLPYTYPPYPVNGIMVSGWDAPFLDANFTYPPSLANEILKEMPDYADNLDLPLSSNYPTRSDELFERFVGKILRGAEQGTKLASRLLRAEEWDVSMLHFQQTDWMQHNLWLYIEEACSTDSNKSARAKKVRDCYQQIDRMLGSLFETLDSTNTIKVVISDHGFGRTRGNIYPNYFLRQWGYLVPLKSAAKNPVKDLLDTAARAARRVLRIATNKRIDSQNLKMFRSFAEGMDATAPHQRLSIDWSNTKAALVVGSETGFVYVNLKGRSPLGNVEPGPEYEKLVAELITKFEAVQHPQTGERYFIRVARGSEVYADKLESVALPDIVLIPADGLHFSYEISNALPELSTHGNHRPEGVLFMEGPDLKSPSQGFNPQLIDLAPTVLHILGLKVPADMDGKVLQEIFVSPQDVHFEEIDNSLVRDIKMEYNAEETELIEQRLKGLGYIE